MNNGCVDWWEILWCMSIEVVHYLDTAAESMYCIAVKVNQLRVSYVRDPIVLSIFIEPDFYNFVVFLHDTKNNNMRCHEEQK